MKHNHLSFVHQAIVKTALCLFFLFLSQISNAQCTFLAFNDNLNVTVDTDCTALITKDFALENDGNCPDDVTVTLIDAAGDHIATGTNEALLPNGFAGTVIQIQINHSSGLAGTTTANVEDNLAPVFTQCQNDTVSCTASIAPPFVTPIEAVDNCDGVVTATFTDTDPGSNCFGGDFIHAILRTYTAVDAAGNSANCQQTILVEHPDISQVVFPNDVTVGCGAVTDPGVTGIPMFDGNPLSDTDFCNFTVTFSDNTIDVCAPAGVEILRTWTVFNHCNNEQVSDIQTIMIEDNVAPTISCPAPLTVGTDAGICSATVILAQPTVTDNCSTFTISVNTSYGQTNFDPFSGVGQGSFTAIYTATDDCGNSSSCSSVVNVIDDEEPTAICDQLTTVSLTSTGLAVVAASDLDDGSFDNCSLVNFLARRDNDPFQNTITFDCADIGDTIDVQVRVRETFNFNMFNDCTVEVIVDKILPPTIACPMNMTVDCNNDLSDLSVFGVPTVVDPCGFTVSNSAVENLSNCGTGSITRTFTSTDNHGNSSSCVQLISVGNNSLFDGTTIQFPADYITNDVCILPDELDPQDLPVGFQTPMIPMNTCSSIFTNYTDQLFQIEFPSCYKIVRTWTVIDECVYDEFDPSTGGIWIDQQTIKVEDITPPVLSDCPADVTVGIDADCQSGSAVFAIPTATDCSNNLTFTNTFNGNDANISGNYPLGTTVVTIAVSDNCGNTSTCQTTVTVEDVTSPTVICEEGIVTELQAMAGGIMAMMNIEPLINEITDNCTSTADLITGMRLVGDTNPPTAATLTFDCTQIGINNVEIWATDAADNGNFCVTTIEIQDNMQLCGSTLQAAISGTIDTEMGDMVEQVEIMIQSGSNAIPDFTGVGGSFAVPNLPLGVSYMVTPQKNIDPDNGVTTFDMIKLKRHILNIEPLGSPLKIIAADVNNSGALSTLDLVQMKKLILQINDNFPAVPAWKFLDKDYQFIDPTNPLNEDLPTVAWVDDLDVNGAEANFWAIKMGDLNYSATTNSLLGADDRSFDGTLNFNTNNQELKAGTIIEVPIRSDNFRDLMGYQFTWTFDSEVLTFKKVDSGELTGLTAEDFGDQRASEGYLTTTWIDNGMPISIDPAAALYTLVFEVKKDGYRLGEVISIGSAMTTAEAYNETEEMLDIDFTVDGQSVKQTSFELYGCQPNPVRTEATISFYLPDFDEVVIQLFDGNGKNLMYRKHQFSAGRQSVEVNVDDFANTGIIFYQITSRWGTFSDKMIVVD